MHDRLYVTDYCASIDTALRTGARGEAYNLSGDQERTYLRLTLTPLRLLGKGPELVQHVTDRPGHDHSYSIATAKARAVG